MAEPRRIIPISAPTADKKETKNGEPTIRFSLTLTESTERTCPEFSYGELVKNALGEKTESKNATVLNSADPFNNADEEDLQSLELIAKHFEQKYGPKSGKKRKRDRIEDLIDATWGYDDTDPFVDDTQAYDELVPAELTTQFGGFYINSGGLEFRPVSSSEESDNDFQDPTKKKKSLKKKRKSVDGVEKEKKRKSKDKDSNPFKKPRKLSQKNGAKSKKSTPTVAELLQRQTKPTSGVRKPVISDDEKDDNDDISKNVTDSINAVVQEALGVANTSEPNTTGGSDSDGNTNSEVSDAVPKLPNNLPTELESNIDKMKAAAISADGKCKFFTADINKTLLQIERQTRELSCAARSSVYGYLGSHLPCSKETLLKRAKKLRLNEQDSRLKEPLQKLKEAVGRVMPQQLDRYQEECQQAAQNKYDKMMDDKIKDGEKITSDDEDDEKTKRNLAPRKKFQWSEEIRKLLCDVVAVKVKTYEMSKIRSQSAEDYLKQFLDAEIKQLWSQGWMQTRMLFKESRAVHGHLTLAPNKQKKFLSVVTKKPSNKKLGSESTGENSNVSAAETNNTLPDYADKTPSACTTEDSQESDELFQIKKERDKERTLQPLPMDQSAASTINMIIKSELAKKDKSTPPMLSSPTPSTVTALKKELLKREKAAAAVTAATNANVTTNNAPISNMANSSPVSVISKPVNASPMSKSVNANPVSPMSKPVNASPVASVSKPVNASPVPAIPKPANASPVTASPKPANASLVTALPKPANANPISAMTKPSNASPVPSMSKSSFISTSDMWKNTNMNDAISPKSMSLAKNMSPFVRVSPIPTTALQSTTTPTTYTSKSSLTMPTGYVSKPTVSTSPGYTSKANVTSNVTPAYMSKTSGTSLAYTGKSTLPAYTSKSNVTTSPSYTNKSNVTTSPAYTNKSNVTTSPSYTNKSNVTTSPAYTNKSNVTTSLAYTSKSSAYTSKASNMSSPGYTSLSPSSGYDATDLSMNARKVTSVSPFEGKMAATSTVQNKGVQEPIVQKLKYMSSPMNLPASGGISAASLSLKKSPSSSVSHGGGQPPSSSPLSLKKSSPPSVPIGVQSTVNDQSKLKIHVPSTLTVPSSSGNRTLFTTASTRLVATAAMASPATNHNSAHTTNHSGAHTTNHSAAHKDEIMSTTTAASLLASFGQNVSKAALGKKDTDLSAAFSRTMSASQDSTRNVYKSLSGKSNSNKTTAFPTYGITKNAAGNKNNSASTVMYSGSPANTATTAYSGNPKKSTVTVNMSAMSGLLPSQLSPQLPVSSSGYSESLISHNVSPRLLQTSSVVSQGPVAAAAAATTTSQALHSVANSSGLLGGSSNVGATAGNMAGYQSITLVDLTRDPPLPKQHPLSRDAIITGPAPGTFIHGQGTLYSSMHSSPPHHQLPPSSLQSFQHQSYTDTSYSREGTPKMPRKYQQ